MQPAVICLTICLSLAAFTVPGHARAGPLESWMTAYLNGAAPSGGSSSSPPPGKLPQLSEVRGCKYRIQGSETLAYVAASLDVMLDHLVRIQADNVDLTAPGVFTAGREINIPCPGSNNPKFFPLYVAGCFFGFTIPRGRMTLLQLVLNPPSDIGGPLTIQGVWTANFQSTGTDLTAPGAFTAGKDIQVPTCGHNSQINPARVPHTKSPVGCFFDPPSNPGSDKVLKLSQLATLLGTDVAGLQKLNPGKNLTPDTVVAAASNASPSPPTVQSADGGKSTGQSTGRLIIPCPAAKV